VTAHRERLRSLGRFDEYTGFTPRRRHSRFIVARVFSDTLPVSFRRPDYESWFDFIPFLKEES